MLANIVLTLALATGGVLGHARVTIPEARGVSDFPRSPFFRLLKSYVLTKTT